VWTKPRKEPGSPALHRQRIISAAIDLLDEEGLDALSMRRLGTRLGAAATSLYRHVANKDELVELVVDEVYGELEVPDADDPAGWRAHAGESAHRIRSMVLRHPWIAAVLGQAGLAYLGPNVMSLSERLMAHFAAAGFQPVEANRAMSTMLAYVLGRASTEAAWLAAIARSGKSERDWVEELWPAAERAAQEHPHLRQSYAAQRGHDPGRDRDDDFDDGLNVVLDGLQARLDSARA
jgi:AcrR family transcriptional regulator